MLFRSDHLNSFRLELRGVQFDGAVCCLSSLNMETWEDWKDEKNFVEDIMRFLDNVLTDYIDRAPPEMARAKYSASRERSVGLGVMGFHSFLQAQGIPFEGAMAKSWNLRIFKHISQRVNEASMLLATERGACPDAEERGVMERFSCKTAIAPTASISIICGGTSACIEPIPANIYTHKTLSGSFSIRNPHLEAVLIEKSKNRDAVWNSILEQGGSVQHLDFLSTDEKDTFKTSFEIDQRWLIELAADRTPYVDQATSLVPKSNMGKSWLSTTTTSTPASDWKNSKAVPVRGIRWSDAVLTGWGGHSPDGRSLSCRLVRVHHAASSSRQGRLKIAHRFSGGASARWPAQSRQGRKTARMRVGKGGAGSRGRLGGRNFFRPCRDCASCVDTPPTDKSLGYFRESLPGQRRGQASSVNSYFPLMRVVGEDHSKPPW